MDNSRVGVLTTSGLLKGKQEGKVEKFLGVPYGEKPVGEKRFKRSEAFKSQAEIDCFGPRGSSYQFGPNFDGDVTPNESLDCLYLNVYRKNGVNKAPVFIWIHGGGFLTGCSSYPMYDGTYYAEQGVIFVSINYRLGCFGYLDFSSLGKEFDSNCGLSDQILALRWVKDNIEAFGGDSENITVCGESAGGISLWALLSSPKTEGLFQKAIFESSLPYCFLSKEQESVYVQSFLEAVGLKKEEAGKLFTLSPKKLVKGIQDCLTKVKSQIVGAMTLAPVVGDDLLPFDSLEASERGINEEVKILIGTNKDEGTIFANRFFKGEQPFGWELNEKMFAESGNGDIYPAIKKYYESHFDADECFHQLAYDNLFIRGMLDNLEVRCHFASCFVFRFDYSTPESRKIGFNACHALEMSFVLHTTEYTLTHLPLLKGADPLEIKEIERMMSSAWISFVKTGQPGWEEYKKNKRGRIMNLKADFISYNDYEPKKLFQGRRINTK